MAKIIKWKSRFLGYPGLLIHTPAEFLGSNDDEPESDP